MLVLSRKIGQQIKIGDAVTVSVVRVQGNRVQLSIDAPRSIRIQRNELRQNDFDGDVERGDLEMNEVAPFTFEVDSEFFHESA